ncbi:MAG: ribosome biogenesis GTPase Der [Pseudomonadota bacterium]
MKPVVALIGRPNVGKSTLFNCLTRKRTAIVIDLPGVTRDRQIGDGALGDRAYYVMDTGGVGTLPEGAPLELIEAAVRQTEQAIAEADVLLFVTDARQGLLPADREVAQQLRRTGKPLTVVVNKTEGLDPSVAVADFHSLGLGEPIPVSASHGIGVEAMISSVLAPWLPAEEGAETQDEADLRIAVIGRPNAGKSTLVNTLLGEDRMVVSPHPGTTRDSIRIPFERGPHRYVLIDTAGLRRRSKISEAVERISVVQTLRAIDEASVVILLLDAIEGVVDQDASIAGYALEQGRPVVIAVNKWDALDAEQRDWARREVDRKLITFLPFSPVHYISAENGQGLEPLLRSCRQAHASAGIELPTAQLNRVLEKAIEAHSPPVVRGRRIRIKFAHQTGRFPPRIVLHGNQVAALPDEYRRYLTNRIRQVFRLVATPLSIQTEEGENPYARPGAAQSRKKRTARTKKGKKR